MSGNERLAAEVRAEAARQRISTRGLAEKMSEPPSTVARKMRAETAMTLDEIEAFAKALGVTVVDLVARAYSMPIGPNGGSGTQTTVPKVTVASLTPSPRATRRSAPKSTAIRSNQLLAA